MRMNDQGADIIERNAATFRAFVVHGEEAAMYRQLKSIRRNVDNAFHARIVN